MTYTVIHNRVREQIGYIDGDSAYGVSGQLFYHVDKHSNLARRGDGQIIGKIVLTDGLYTLDASADNLFEA